MRPISRREFDQALASNELHLDRMSPDLAVLFRLEGIDPAKIAGQDRVIREGEWGALYDLIASGAGATKSDRIERVAHIYEALKAEVWRSTVAAPSGTGLRGEMHRAPARPEADPIQAEIERFTSLRAASRHTAIEVYRAALRAREVEFPRPDGVPAALWNAMPALERWGISTRDAECFMATGSLPDPERLTELEKAAVGRGSWTAVNSFTILIGMRRSALAAERQAIADKKATLPADAPIHSDIDAALAQSEQIDRGLKSYANTIYTQASEARERTGHNLLASAKTKMAEAAKARDAGDVERAAALEAKAQALRNKSAKIAHAEAEYRTKIPRFDATSTYHLAAQGQIDTGAAKVASMRRGESPLSDEAPPELTDAATTANGVPGAARLLDAAATGKPNTARSHAHLALERARQNALGGFHDTHVTAGSQPERHRQAYFDTRAAEIRLIAERLEIFGSTSSAAEQLEAGQLAGERAGIIQELDGVIATAAHTDAQVAEQRESAGALGNAVEAAEQGAREAEARDVEQREMSSAAKEATEAWFGDTFKDSDEERRDRHAIADADSAQRLTTLQVGVARARHAELGERNARATEQLVRLEAQQLRDGADSARARRSLSNVLAGDTSTNQAALDITRREADASARLGASYLDRAEAGATKSNVSLTEVAGARLSLSRYWVRSTETDLLLGRRSGAAARLDTAAGLADRADAHRAAVGESSEREQLASEVISTRSSLASAYAEHRPADSRRQLERAVAAATELSHAELVAQANADIGVGAANSLVRHNVRFLEVVRAGHHDDTADDYFHRTATQNLARAAERSDVTQAKQTMERVDRALDRVEEIFDVTRDQIDNGEQLAGAQAEAISRAEITAAQATMSSVITGPVWLFTAGHVDMKGEVANGFEDGAGSHRRVVKEHSDRMRQGAADLAAGFASARRNGEAFRFLDSVRLMSLDYRELAIPSVKEAKQRGVGFIRTHVPTGAATMAPWSEWSAHALVDRGNPNALARAFHGSVLGYEDALELYGDRKLAYLDESMNDMLAARSESIKSTTDGMGWIIALNTAGEVGLGIVLTGGIGSVGAVAKSGQALNSARVGIQAANAAKNMSAFAGVARSLAQFRQSHQILHTIGVTATVGTGMAGANIAVARAAGRNTGAARGFEAFTNFIPFGAANRAIGLRGMATQVAFGGGQAALASAAVPAAAELLGLERNEVAQAAMGVLLNVFVSAGAASAMKVAGRRSHDGADGHELTPANKAVLAERALELAADAATPGFVASCPQRHPRLWNAVSKLRGADAETIKGRALLAAERSLVCRRTMEEHGPIAARLIGALGEETYVRAFGEAPLPRDLLKLGPAQLSELIVCCKNDPARVRTLIDAIAQSENPRALIEAARRSVPRAIELAARKVAGLPHDAQISSDVEISTRQLSALERSALHARSPTAPKNAVVVGAGPAGLLTALSLARRGVKVTIVEQREGYTRPVNLGVRMQMLDAIAKVDPEVVRDVLAVSAPIAQKEALGAGGDHHITRADQPRRPDANLFSPGARAMLRDKSTHVVRLSDLERVLHHRLEHIEAVDIANGVAPRVRFLHNHQADLTDTGDGTYRVAVEGIETQKSGGKSARVRNGQRMDLGTPDLVFIAEGAGSATRGVLGVPHAPLPEASRFISGYVDQPLVAAMPDGSLGARSRYRTTQYLDPEEGVVNLRQIAGGNPQHGRSWVLVEVPPHRVFQDPAQVESYYREQAQIVMGISPDAAAEMKIEFGPNLFRMQQAISEHAVVGQNVFLIGDAVGNGHFLVGGGTNVLGVPHLDAVDRLDTDLAAGVEPSIARDRYNRRVMIATKAWLEEGKPYFSLPTPDEYSPAIHGEIRSREDGSVRSLNVYGEGEAQSFMDVATDGYYANGRPMTHDLPDHSAPEIFVRSAPLNPRTLREIERLIAPGGRVTLLQAEAGSQARTLLDHFAGKAELIQDGVITRTDEHGGVEMRLTQLRFPKD